MQHARIKIERARAVKQVGEKPALVFYFSVSVVESALTRILSCGKVSRIYRIARIIIQSAAALDLTVVEPALEDELFKGGGIVEPHLARVIDGLSAVYPHILCKEEADEPRVEKPYAQYDDDYKY